MESLRHLCNVLALVNEATLGLNQRFLINPVWLIVVKSHRRKSNLITIVYIWCSRLLDKFSHYFQHSQLILIFLRQNQHVSQLDNPHWRTVTLESLIERNNKHRRLDWDAVAIFFLVQHLMETILSWLSEIFKSPHGRSLNLLINLYVWNGPCPDYQVLIVLVYDRAHLQVDIVLNTVLKQIGVAFSHLHSQLRSLALAFDALFVLWYCLGIFGVFTS